jgi:hypothetical protein
VTSVANGIAWATANGANVINMSLGGNGACPLTLQTAIDDAWAHNIVIVSAAGNDGFDEAFWPADCNHVVPVASTDQNDARSLFGNGFASNYGTWVTVAAPGSSIYSTVNPQVNGNALYGLKSGTSMATPHVAGLAALLRTTQWGTSAQAVIDRLTGTGDAEFDAATSWAYRRINASAAVDSLPVITGLSPASVFVGSGGTTLTISGFAFMAGAQVLWNGVPRAATFVSNQQLTLTITAADAQTPKIVTIAVRNTDGRTSASVPFTILVSPSPPARSATGTAAVPNTNPALRPGQSSPSGNSPPPAPLPVSR